DRDEWRTRIREAGPRSDPKAEQIIGQIRTLGLRSGDRQALEKLADAIPMRDVPPTTLRLLGSTLLRVGVEENGLSVLREAQRRYPDDLWINVALAQSPSMLPSWQIALQIPLRVDAVQAVTSLATPNLASAMKQLLTVGFQDTLAREKRRARYE